MLESPVADEFGSCLGEEGVPRGQVEWCRSCSRRWKHQQLQEKKEQQDPAGEGPGAGCVPGGDQAAETIDRAPEAWILREGNEVRSSDSEPISALVVDVGDESTTTPQAPAGAGELKATATFSRGSPNDKRT